MTNPKIKTMNVHELKKKMDNTPDLCLIDVREADEWQEIHIPNALHIPKDTILSLADKIPNREQAIYLYCKGGVRSMVAAQRLVDIGYQDIYSIDGGIMEWAKFGYPTQTISPSPIELTAKYC
jgi:rhodanese-related sulfurtransferase